MKTQPTESEHVPTEAHWLGYAGLLPQLLAVAGALHEGEWRWMAQAAGFAYAALIFSFLGGIWWGQAITSKRPPKWVFAISVIPSLIALALFLPWVMGWNWPGPSLLWLGLLIALSPIVDRRLGLSAPGFMRLRVHLSIGLGALTIVLGAVTLATATF
uniref:DUF3429 domain-containing protein n=1 Tax=Parerythrobacter lutipelagi TaxID=1964208 RepID=UPI0010F6163B|nr:DUF3429 domain-containing protein [Parerythrobacter lutipelagi]